jgi:hypothetical protein
MWPGYRPCAHSASGHLPANVAATAAAAREDLELDGAAVPDGLQAAGQGRAASQACGPPSRRPERHARAGEEGGSGHAAPCVSLGAALASRLRLRRWAEAATPCKRGSPLFALIRPWNPLSERSSQFFAAGRRYAPGRIRTCDFCLRRAALYPLSYGRSAAVAARAESTVGSGGAGSVDERGPRQTGPPSHARAGDTLRRRWSSP